MLQNVLMMSLNTTFLLHMPMKGRGMNFSENYFSPWLFVSSIFQRVMGSGRLGGRGGGGEARNGTGFHMEQQEKTLYN